MTGRKFWLGSPMTTRLASELGVPLLRHGAEERIHVDMQNSCHVEPLIGEAAPPPGRAQNRSWRMSSLNGRLAGRAGASSG